MTTRTRRGWLTLALLALGTSLPAKLFVLGTEGSQATLARSTTGTQFRENFHAAFPGGPPEVEAIDGTPFGFPDAFQARNVHYRRIDTHALFGVTIHTYQTVQNYADSVATLDAFFLRGQELEWLAWLDAVEAVSMFDIEDYEQEYAEGARWCLRAFALQIASESWETQKGARKLFAEALKQRKLHQLAVDAPEVAAFMGGVRELSVSTLADWSAGGEARTLRDRGMALFPDPEQAKLFGL